MITKTHKSQMKRIIATRFGLDPDCIIINKITGTGKAVDDEMELIVWFEHIHTGFCTSISLWLNTRDGRRSVHSFPPREVES